MIHQFTIDGTNIVLDVYSGAVHEVDDMTKELIAALGTRPTSEEIPAEILEELSKKYPAEELKEAYEDILELCDEEMLFTEDPYREYAKNWHKNSVVKAMCLHIAHDCNLRCKYCFAGTGSYEGQRS